MRTILACIVLCLAAPVHAATLYAKACPAGCSWAAAATWSSTGSAGVDSSGPPTSADAVIFEAGSGNVIIDAVGPTALSVSMTGGTGNYSGTLSCEGGWTLVLARTTTGTIWQASATATMSVQGCVVSLADVSAGVVTTFAGGGLTYGTLQLTRSTAATVAITGANTFQKITLATNLPSGDPSITFPAGVTTTIFDWYTDTSMSIFGHFFTVSSATPGLATTLTKSSGVVNIASVALVDITATGGATWCDGYASADGGGNTGWSFTACPIIQRQLLTGVG